MAGATAALLALAPDVEQRVVDPDRHAEQQDHGLRRVAGCDQVAGERRQPDRRQHAREREQHRQPGGHEGAEGEDQDCQRDRHGRELGPLEVAVEGGVELVIRTRGAELGDREVAVRVLDGRHGVQHGLDLRVGLLLVARDLELDEDRTAVGRDLAGVARAVRRAERLHVRLPANRVDDVADDGAERRVVGGRRARLHEDALAGTVVEPRRGENLLGLLRLTRGRIGVRE